MYLIYSTGGQVVIYSFCMTLNIDLIDFSAMLILTGPLKLSSPNSKFP